MPYRVEDQLYVSLTLGDADLSNHYENVLHLSLLEEAGTRLPVVQLSVRSTDRQLPRLINEGNLLNVVVGANDQTEPTGFMLQRPTLVKSSADAWEINANGLKSTYASWARSRVEISRKMSGVERILEVARRAEGNVFSNTNASNDEQRWVQYGCPDKLHVDDIWLHCDMGDSFPMLACALDGFVLKDAKALAGEEPVFRFGNLGGNHLRYDWSPGVEHMGGFFASAGARGVKRPLHDLEKGESAIAESDPTLFMSLGDVPFASDFSKISDSRKTLTRNMHPNYWQSHAHNTTQLALYSSLRFSLTWENRYLPVRPLDLVYLQNEDIGEEEDSAAESFSGYYIVSKVARIVSRNTLSTTCQLVRECFNSNKL